jgi:hypothetical protein
MIEIAVYLYDGWGIPWVVAPLVSVVLNKKDIDIL